ncbi:hypothetical protein [Paracidovorax wautersii]|uniref:Uncharacterized protein n=1 Tax=Paracidovorax wautersii TaxID=1177982 RepID=A0ABU1IC98_9BURK|nr:hypothetical protein [Paracidovorax wautersii]MDR6214812.1 hypothetical protein [Paracidovorax wautersii]
MTSMPRSAAPHRRLQGLAAALLAASLLLPATPSHAFWGLLGKAGKAASAGKSAGAAGTAGKAAVAGTAAAGGAELAGVGAKGVLAADDAARRAGKAPLAEGSLAHTTLSANALPPEVARYLSKPAKSLTEADTSHMVQLYQDLMARAGKTGDFTAVERMPPAHGAKTLQGTQATPPAAAAAPPVAAGAPAASGLSTSAELSLHALRLLAHAAGAGNRSAQQNLQQRCQSAAPAGLEAEQAAMCSSARPAPAAPSPKP